MTRLTALRRRACLGIVLVALLVMSSACDGGRPAAATVNGRPISDATVSAFVRALTNGSSAAKKAFAGEGDGTWNTATVANVVGYLVKNEFLVDAVSAQHVTITAADRTKARTTVLPTFATSSTDDGSKTFAKLPKSLQALIIDGTAGEIALQAKLGKGEDRTAEARKVYDANPGQFVTVCLSTITVQTQAALTLVRAELKQGQNFAALAKKSSIDNFASAGGANGCSSLAGYPANIIKELSTGSPTDIKGPFENQQGAFVLVSVTSRRPSTFASAKATIISQLPAAGSARLSAYLAKAERAAKISIDPRYGSWDAKSGSVVPPHDPLGTTTTTSPATTAPAG